MTTQQNPNQAAVAAIQAVSEAIRELGQVPSGHLYAALMGHMSLEFYQSIIELLKSAELVSEENFLLKWKGPKI